jgi:light-regulated signal transduction histidine kinase (bacteriophytochrome)
MLERKYRDVLDGQGTTFIEHIVAGAQRINRLVEGLVQFSRIGDVDAMVPTHTRASAAVAEALSALKLSIEEVNAQITFERLPDVLADEAHLCQVFQNLIENAIKYRDPALAPVIRITATRDGTQFVFFVQDNGIGIPAEFQSRIFEPFKRLHGTEIKGAGIGLATCKRIIERYGGRIWVISNETNKGATFCFTLPAAATADQTHA